MFAVPDVADGVDSGHGAEGSVSTSEKVGREVLGRVRHEPQRIVGNLGPML
jgi:hypothetical protein